MAQPVNFDNAATTFPKPPEVYAAVSYALEKQGGNPGRGGHPLSMAAGEAVYAAREQAVLRNIFILPKRLEPPQTADMHLPLIRQAFLRQLRLIPRGYCRLSSHLQSLI